MYTLYSCILDFTDLGFPRSSDIFTIHGIPCVRTCMCLPVNHWIINGRGLGVGGSGGQGRVATFDDKFADANIMCSLS